MAYRPSQAAEDQIDEILLESARAHGIEAAGRYSLLILVAMTALGDDPRLPGSIDIRRLPGIRRDAGAAGGRADYRARAV